MSKSTIITTNETKETVNHPSHYNNSKYEVIDIIEEFSKDYSSSNAFTFGNIIKYVLRAKRKNGIEDLKKAKWYIDRLIEKWDLEED